MFTYPAASSPELCYMYISLFWIYFLVLLHAPSFHNVHVMLWIFCCYFEEVSARTEHLVHSMAINCLLHMTCNQVFHHITAEHDDIVDNDILLSVIFHVSASSPLSYSNVHAVISVANIFWGVRNFLFFILDLHLLTQFTWPNVPNFLLLCAFDLTSDLIWFVIWFGQSLWVIWP